MSAPSVYVPHGTPSGYTYHGCRCTDCVEGMRAYRRQWAAQNPNYYARASKASRRRVRRVQCTACPWRGQRAGIPIGGGGPKPCPRCLSPVEAVTAPS